VNALTPYPRYDHNVGGDPVMPVWTANPTALAMTYRYYMEGETYVVEAFIKDKDNNPLTGVTVNLWVGDLYYLTGETNETGKIRFEGLGAFENGKLTAWKHNYKPALADGIDVPQ
jgi:hypothetical protein